MQVELPWPPTELSPNSSAKLRDKLRAKKTYRDLCWGIAKEANLKTDCAKPVLDFKFYPPNNRKRDLDNAFASMKYAIDGISYAIGIDDSQFGYVLHPIFEAEKPGKVVVTL